MYSNRFEHIYLYTRISVASFNCYNNYQWGIWLNNHNICFCNLCTFIDLTLFNYYSRGQRYNGVTQLIEMLPYNNNTRNKNRTNEKQWKPKEKSPANGEFSNWKKNKQFESLTASVACRRRACYSKNNCFVWISIFVFHNFVLLTLFYSWLFFITNKTEKQWEETNAEWKKWKVKLSWNKVKWSQPNQKH